VASFLILIAALAVCALVGGGIWMINAQGNRTKGLLMIVTAIVIAGNILIWTVPI
jgi:hypothetical protein